MSVGTYAALPDPSDVLDPGDLLGGEELVNELDRDRALTDRRGDAVHRAVPDVARREDPGDAGFQRERAACERPTGPAVDVRAGPDEPAGPPRQLVRQPVRGRVGADHHEEGVSRHRLRRAVASPT